ncbi:MAG: hypothetical protein RR902_07475, partial [Oscillospiraceae bacterium]
IMSINLQETYAKQIQRIFTTKSLISGRLNNDYTFSGAKTVKVTTPQTVEMSDYQRTGTNRYGIPAEMQDTCQELTLSQDKCFSMIIDKGNDADQGYLKSAGKILSLQISERAIPQMDKYCFKTLAEKAGKIVADTTVLTKANICDIISEGTAYMDDKEVPQDGRILYLPVTSYKFLKHSDEFLAVEKIAEKAIVQGQVGTYDNMTVIKVPQSRWPSNVNFMIVYKNSATVPVKLNDTKIHKDPPGISGNLLEGRQYYDLFVFGAKADGVYVNVDTSAGKGKVLASPAINAATGVITPAEGATIKYTTDGTDPRYS